MKRSFLAGIVVLAAVLAADALAQGPLLRSKRGPGAAAQPSQPSAVPKSGEAPALNWDQSPSELVLQAYGERLNKTVLIDPATPKATITLKSREGQKLTQQEYLEAIEVILEMNGIHLEPYGESFIRAIPRKDARREGIPLLMNPDAELKESGRVISMMIAFKHIATDEAQKALEGLKSNSGILLVFERTNSILVTDTEQNINRMLEIVKLIDVASPVTEIVEYIQIKYASATEVKQVIDSIVQEAMKEQEKNGKQVNQTQQQQHRPPFQRQGLLGRNQKPEVAPVNNESLVMTVSDADRGMIRGKVVTIADDRSNKILIITSASNMKFFKEVIAALDVETTPDTVVKVYRLKYADAEDVSDMINDLIGNAPSGKGSGKGNQNQNAKNGKSGSLTRGAPQQSAAKKPANQRSGDAKAGELSKDNTTVLADKRINGLVVMTSKELVPTIEQIIESMDIKLSQVLIETMILQVNISEEISTGIDWIHSIKSGPVDGDGNPNVLQSITGGGGNTSVGNLANLAAVGASDAYLPGSSGLSYYFLDEGLDIGALIKASKSDSRTKLVASPIIMTVDNKEATIEATRMRYLLKGYTYSGSTYNGSAVPDYEQKEIGLTVKVTPKINPNGTVMLEIEEEFSSLGENQTIQAATGGTTNNTQQIGGISVETTVTRKLSADVTVDNRQTVVLGGLSQTETSQEDTGIPILKDIPYIGRYLFGSTKDVETRQELLMFLTPYVLDDAESATLEARRRKRTLSDVRPWDDHGWSASPLADPVSLKEQLKRKQREWKQDDENFETQLKLEESTEERAEKIRERAEDLREKRMKEAEKLAKQINAAEEAKAAQRADAEMKVREENASLLEQLKGEAASSDEKQTSAEAQKDPKAKGGKRLR